MKCNFFIYRRLHLPVNVGAQNMFSRDVKRLSFGCQTLKFSRPNVKFYFSTLLKGTMLSINEKGRNYHKGVPLSGDLRNQVKELAQDYSFSEVGQRLHIKGAVSKIVKQYNLTGSTAPKTLHHVRTVPKCSFQDSILLETMVQASGSSSLKENSKFIFLIFHQGCIQHQSSFVFFSTICPNQLGQELPEGLQTYLGKSHACNWECFQIILGPKSHSVQSSHLYQMICGCVRWRVFLLPT